LKALKSFLRKKVRDKEKQEKEEKEASVEFNARGPEETLQREFSRAVSLSLHFVEVPSIPLNECRIEPSSKPHRQTDRQFDRHAGRQTATQAGRQAGSREGNQEEKRKQQFVRSK